MSDHRRKYTDAELLSRLHVVLRQLDAVAPVLDAMAKETTILADADSALKRSIAFCRHQQVTLNGALIGPAKR